MRRKIQFRTAIVICLSVTAFVGFNSCSKNDVSNLVDKRYDVQLASTNMIPAVQGSQETGSATLTLHADNTLEWSIQVDPLVGQDTLTTAGIFSGDAVTNGGMLVSLVDNQTIKFVGVYANGSIQLNTDQVAKLKAGDVYLNVSSVHHAEGLIRGQIDKKIVWALNLAMSPLNEIPQITNRTDHGTAILRFTDDGFLYSKIDLVDILPSDVVTTANIEEGGTGEPGGSMVLLAASFSDYNVPVKIKVLPETLAHLQSDPHHLNVHSALKPNGLMCCPLE